MDDIERPTALFCAGTAPRNRLCGSDMILCPIQFICAALMKWNCEFVMSQRLDEHEEHPPQRRQPAQCFWGLVIVVFIVTESGALLQGRMIVPSSEFPVHREE